MHADTETRNPWIGWRFYTQEDLAKALDEYASFRGVPLVQQYGELGGGDADKALSAHEAVMKANEAIDHAMLRLHHWSRLFHRLLDFYFRSGLCYEHDGWQRAIDRVSWTRNDEHEEPYKQLFYHCTTQRERERQKALFEVLLAEAIECLFKAHNVRPRRNP